MKKEIEINSLIGERILSLRDIKKLSRSELARALHITHQQLDKYEKGINRISAAKIAIICEELKIDPLFFYSNLAIKNKISEDMKKDLNKLITHFIQITKDSKRKAIINLIKEL